MMQEIAWDRSIPQSPNNVRWLGAVTILFAPFLYIASQFFSEAHPNPGQFYASLFALLYLTGAAASVIAMQRMRVTGSGKGAAVLFAFQIVGLILAMGFDVLMYAAPDTRTTSPIFIITDMAYPFSHVIWLIVGAAVWKAGVWRGWRVAAPFVIGLALPVTFAGFALLGRDNSGWIFFGGVTLGYALLGLAILTSKPSPSPSVPNVPAK